MTIIYPFIFILVTQKSKSDFKLVVPKEAVFSALLLPTSINSNYNFKKS